VEHTQTIATVGMGNVIGEFTEWGVLGANIRVERGPSRVGLGIEPETIVVCSRSVISSEDVIWVSDPEACWGLIRVQQTP
jgi:hypothetical protein